MLQHGRGGLWGPASLVGRGSSGASSGGEGRSPSAGVHLGSTGRHDWTRLLGGTFGAEVGWLYPLALVFGLTWRRGTPRADPVRGGFVIWERGCSPSASSSADERDSAYLASLAPPLAALSGAGIVLSWRAYRRGERRGWVLPLAVAAELAWAAWLWSGYRRFLPWAPWATIAAGATAIAVMVAAKLSRRARTSLVAFGIAAGVAAMLAAPATWATSVLDIKYAGTSFDASAGPAGIVAHPDGTDAP